jgi:Ca-activated chloride channel family protein
MKPDIVKRRVMMSEPQLSASFAPVSAEAHRTIELAMQRLWLVGRILPVGARLLVRHTFRSAETKPLEVIYSFGLPRDAALRRFRITGSGFSVSSDLKPIEEAVKVYEEGLEQGHLSALARPYGDGLVNLTVGNIRPGEEVTVNLEILAGVENLDDGLRFRFPFTLAPTYHARARAAEVRPGVGEIELPAGEFGDLLLPQFSSDASSLHEVGFDLTVALTRPILETASPSHAVRIVGQGPRRSRISLATAKDVPDRDLILDVRTGAGDAGVIGGTAGDGKGHFAAVAPSAFFKANTEDAAEEPRRIVFVLDRSGSMQGAAIEQARKAVEACLGALDERDSFGLVAFDDQVEPFGRGLVKATKKAREKAAEFLARIDARGGTEMSSGLKAGADMLGVAMENAGGGDILLLTDGQVSGTERIIEGARATGIRVHCLGIGSASQDRFLAQLARETGAVSRFLTPRERVDLGALELFASAGRPLGSGLEAKVEGFGDGYVSPDPPRFVFSGTPVVLFGETSGPGEGRLELKWDGAGRRQNAVLPFVIGSGGEGETLRLLRGARLITDLESRLAAATGSGALERRETDRIEKRLRTLSETYGLASLAMALVAVVRRPGDRPDDLPVTRVIPVGFAQDIAWGGYFGAGVPPGPTVGLYVQDVCMEEDILFSESALHQTAAKKDLMLGNFPRVFKMRESAPPRDAAAGPTFGAGGPATAAPSALVTLASLIEPDGGMPGRNEEERVLATIIALLRFLAEGHAANRGAFRPHVKRLLRFLESWLKRTAEHHEKPTGSAAGLGGESDETMLRVAIVSAVVGHGRSGLPVAGDWTKSRPEPNLWKELEAALREEQN